MTSETQAIKATFAQQGYHVFGPEPAAVAWADAACRSARDVLRGPVERRHGGTWCVGVDALPNGPDGSVDQTPLTGAWENHVDAPEAWHRAQLSVIYPGYPGKDPDESEKAHRYRRLRDAAHVDGLLPEGPQRRRHLREPHGFILGLPLNPVAASPLVVWERSQQIIRDAFIKVYQGVAPHSYGDIDITDIYQAARREVFAKCKRVPIRAAPGEVILLHRHLLHGVAPWDGVSETEGRMIAYFRPTVAPAVWLAPDPH